MGHHVELLGNRWLDGHMALELGGPQAKKISRTEPGHLPLLKVERGGNEQRELRDMVKEGEGKAGESSISETKQSVF